MRLLGPSVSRVDGTYVQYSSHFSTPVRTTTESEIFGWVKKQAL